MRGEARLVDLYTEGDAGEILALEVALLREVAQRFTEHLARRVIAPGIPSALEIVSALAVELLPEGPAPSMRDALDALDRLFATWQVEPAAFQRVQARRLAEAGARLALLLELFLAPPTD